MDGGACFDSTGAYRYRLWREWDAALPSVTFVMLNPSTADAERDDPTIRRCIGFARSWGFGQLEVLNICAYRATDPRRLFAAKDPVGPENASHLRAATENAAMIVAAWGNHGRGLNWPLFRGCVHNLGLTKLGQPRHPLRILAETQPLAWTEYRTDGQSR